MQEETRADVNELIETIEELGWSVGNYTADEGGRTVRGADGYSDEHLEWASVELKAKKDYRG